MLDSLMDMARGSIARLKSKQDKGSPWRTPLVIAKGSLLTPLIITVVFALLYMLLMVLIKLLCILNFFKASHRYLWAILSYAFSWSRATIAPFLSSDSA